MEKIDKEKFIKDIKKDLGIKERKYGENYKFETFEGFDDLGELFEYFFREKSLKDNKKKNNRRK